MAYVVKVGISQTIEFRFENMGDAVDFVSICLDNGYRATVIPCGDEHE